MNPDEFVKNFLKQDPLSSLVKAIENLGSALDQIGAKLEGSYAPQISRLPEIRRPSNQKSEKYCCACTQRHIAAAIHYVEEAERWPSHAEEKLRQAFIEISGAESEIESTEFRSPETREKMRELLSVLRTVRLSLFNKKPNEIKKMLDSALSTAFEACQSYVKSEQLESIKEYLYQVVPNEKLDQAAEIVAKAAAGETTYEDASKKLSEIIGREVRLEYTDQGLTLKIR